MWVCEYVSGPKTGMNPCPGYSEKFAICARVCVSVCVPFCICVSVSVVSVSVHASVSVGSVLDKKRLQIYADAAAEAVRFNGTWHSMPPSRRPTPPLGYICTCDVVLYCMCYFYHRKVSSTHSHIRLVSCSVSGCHSTPFALHPVRHCSHSFIIIISI